MKKIGYIVLMICLCCWSEGMYGAGKRMTAEQMMKARMRVAGYVDESEPNKTDPVLETAIGMINSGTYAEATETLQRVKKWKAYPNSTMIVMERFNQWLSYQNAHPMPEETRNKFLLFYADELEDYGMALYNIGSYRRASIALSVCCTIREKLEVKQDYHHAELLWRAGGSAIVEHEYAHGIPLMKRAYELISRLKSPRDSKSVLAALSLGVAYLDYGYYPEAEEYLRLALLNPKDIAYPSAYCQLAQMYINLGDYDEAVNCYVHALENDKALREVAGYRETVVMGLAYCRAKAEDPEAPFHSVIEYMYVYAQEAGTLDGKRILNELSRLSFNKPPYTVMSQYASRYLYDQGDYVQSLELGHSSRESAAIVYGSQHMVYADVLRQLGLTYSALDSTEQAIAYSDTSAHIYRHLFTESIAYLSARQRSQYWHTIRHHFQDEYPLLAYRTYPKDARIGSLAYDNELFVKGLLLSSSEAVRQSILESGDSMLVAQWSDLTARRQAIMALQDKDPHSELIGRYEKEAEALEQAITRKSAVYREDMRQWSLTWDSIRAALQPDEVAIEYMRVPMADSTMYCALLIRDNSSSPMLIPLFEEDSVRALLHRSTAAKDSVAIQQTYAYEAHGEALAQLVWANVQPYIRAGETIYFAPTGILHQLAIENLPYDSSETMAEHYHPVRLSSTRELAMNRPTIAHEQATLYGDIRYNVAAEAMAAEHDKYRGATDYVRDLPGTREEVRAIRSILEEEAIRVQVYSSYEANEESVKALSGKKQNILHFATHGFYRTDSTQADAMDRCGLLFAGANMALRGHGDRLDEGVLDGILTAKEISLLDFRGADIVVLSACETGLGDISGEGVFGLQRAFKISGSQTILMSLWEVSDEATRMLMTSFYRKMHEGQSKRQAFIEAQEEVKQAYASPYYWAGFVLLD